MEFVENNEYTPVSPNYYDYGGKDILKLDYKNDLFEYDNINIVAYTVNNEKKCPFQQFLLSKSVINSENFSLLLAFCLSLLIGDMLVFHILLLFVSNFLYCVCLWENIVGVVVNIFVVDDTLFRR